MTDPQGGDELPVIAVQGQDVEVVEEFVTLVP